MSPSLSFERNQGTVDLIGLLRDFNDVNRALGSIVVAPNLTANLSIDPSCHAIVRHGCRLRNK